MNAYLSKISITLIILFCFSKSIAQDNYSYFSANQNKEVELHQAALNKSNLYVKSGSKVILEAPKTNDKAFYIWEGPNGIRTYKAKLIFDNIKSKNQGYYTLKIYKKGKLELGEVNLLVDDTNLGEVNYNEQNHDKYVVQEISNFKLKEPENNRVQVLYKITKKSQNLDFLSMNQF